MTFLLFTSPISLKYQYLKKTYMYFGQIWSQWSLSRTISYLHVCKLTIQDGRQGPLLKIAYAQKWQYLKNNWLKLIRLCARMFLVWSCFDFLNGNISNICKLTIQDGRQGLLLKIAQRRKWRYLKNYWLKSIQLCARMFLVDSRFDIL